MKAVPPQWASPPLTAEGGVQQTPRHHQVEPGRVSRRGRTTGTPTQCLHPLGTGAWLSHAGPYDLCFRAGTPPPTSPSVYGQGVWWGSRGCKLDIGQLGLLKSPECWQTHLRGMHACCRHLVAHGMWKGSLEPGSLVTRLPASPSGPAYLSLLRSVVKSGPE